MRKSVTQGLAGLFGLYRRGERDRLRRLVRSPDWQSILAQPAIIERYRAERLPASSPPSQLRGVPAYLIQANGERLHAAVRAGQRARERLVDVLGDWELALRSDATHPLLFLGITLTTRCSFQPRCLYCNQKRATDELTVERAKELVDEAARPVPPYVYLTGGEPLLLGATIYGRDGLIAHAAAQGCAVNLNTNAALITPEIALNLVRSGLTRLHISLDSADPSIQATLFGRRRRVSDVWRGIRNVLVARELLGSEYPRIHINCVVTRLNLDGLPDLLRAIWAFRPVEAGSALDDWAFHLIPVGGPENASIRPTAEDWYRLYTRVWERADAVWQEEQTAAGVPDAARNHLHEALPFANPYMRVDHHMALREYCEQAARGIYWHGALCERCWVAPSQACVLPDGSQHWCGAHAIRRPPPIGSALSGSLRANIRAAVGALRSLPGVACEGCAGATCAINQATRSTLYARVDEVLRTIPDAPRG